MVVRAWAPAAHAGPPAPLHRLQRMTLAAYIVAGAAACLRDLWVTTPCPFPPAPVQRTHIIAYQLVTLNLLRDKNTGLLSQVGAGGSRAAPMLRAALGRQGGRGLGPRQQLHAALEAGTLGGSSRLQTPQPTRFSSTRSTPQVARGLGADEAALESYLSSEKPTLDKCSLVLLQLRFLAPSPELERCMPVAGTRVSMGLQGDGAVLNFPGVVVDCSPVAAAVERMSPEEAAKYEAAMVGMLQRFCSFEQLVAERAAAGAEGPACGDGEAAAGAGGGARGGGGAPPAAPQLPAAFGLPWRSQFWEEQSAWEGQSASPPAAPGWVGWDWDPALAAELFNSRCKQYT